MKNTNMSTQRDTELASKVWKTFLGRCVMCWRPADCIHEIVPRSKIIDWDTEDNEVTLCNSCHDIIHINGALKYVDELKEKALDFKRKKIISD